MIRKQAYHGPNHWAETCRATGSYYMLLARVLERWVLDAQGSITDTSAKYKPGIQRRAIEDLDTRYPEDMRVLSVVAHQLGIAPRKILDGLREQVAA